MQICPVGALTGASYRFRSRPFDLVSTPSVCEHCASGCRQRTDHRRGAVTRRLAGSDPDVNLEWNCDKGRWAFGYATQPDRLAGPLVRDDDGVLQPASWPEALAAAAAGLSAARGRAGVLTGGRLTLEDAYGYAKFARLALGTNDIDMRARPHSDEEASFLGTHVAGRSMTMDYGTLEAAPAVLLAGFEPEEESPIVFLRLRKAVRQRGLTVFSLAALASDGLARLNGTLLATVPGGEAAALRRLASSSDPAAEALRQSGSVILAGERLAEVPGALTAAAALAESTGAQLAWIPRRAGERGAIEAGALPGLLPGGRSIADPAHRIEVARTWGVATLPALPGRSASEILAAAADGDTRRAADRRGGPGRPARPGRRAGRAGRHRVHRQPGAAGQRGHRPGRRGLPGRRRGREGGHVRELGGPAGLVRGRAVGSVRRIRPGDPRRDRRRDGRPPGPARGRRGPRRAGRAGLRRGRAARRRDSGRVRVACRAGRRPGRARRYCPPGTIFSTPGGCRTGSRTWPGRPAPPPP